MTSCNEIWKLWQTAVSSVHSFTTGMWHGFVSCFSTHHGGSCFANVSWGESMLSCSPFLQNLDSCVIHSCLCPVTQAFKGHPSWPGILAIGVCQACSTPAASERLRLLVSHVLSQSYHMSCNLPPMQRYYEGNFDSQDPIIC